MSKEQDRLFFRNFSVTIGILAVMLLVLVLFARFYGINREAQLKQREVSTLKRTAPVGRVEVEETEQSVASPTTALQTETDTDPPANNDQRVDAADIAVNEQATAATIQNTMAQTVEDVTAAEKMPASQVADKTVDGKNIYQQICVACHAVQGIGAPIVGDIEQWAPRIAQGVDVLYNRAINGYVGPDGYMMPARGGGNFSDEEVMAAVDYMIGASQ